MADSVGELQGKLRSVREAIDVQQREHGARMTDMRNRERELLVRIAVAERLAPMLQEVGYGAPAPNSESR